MLPVTTLSKSEASNLILYLYRDTVSHIGEVKYSHLSFQHGHPKYQDLGLPSIGLEQTTSQCDFFLKTHLSYILNIYTEKGIILILGQM